MSDIILTSGVRQNLLSLQTTAALMATTQNRLATGKKVNSALDNPTNFFLSQSLSNRGNDLNALLDSIGQAQQALKASDTGLASLTKLVQSAKATATQAQQAAAGTATYSLAVTGNTAIVADSTRVTSSDFTTAIGSATASVKSSYTFNATAAIAAASNLDTITIGNGTQSITFEEDTAGDGVALGNVAFVTGTTTAANFKTILDGVFGAANVTNNAGVITIAGDFTTNFTGNYNDVNVQTAAAVVNTASVDGDKLTLTQGATTSTYRYVASGAAPATEGTFTSLANLVTAIDALAGTIDATTVGNTVQIDDAAGFTVGGDIGNLLGFNGVGSTTAYANNYNTTLAGLTGILSVAVGTGAAQTIDFGTVTTKSALTTALGNLTGVTATINGSNFVSITSTASDTVTISGTGTAASGLFAGANIGVNTPTPTAGTSTIRSGLQTQYNALLTQIDQLAADTSYNGINLLMGANLKVVFNEQGTSSLTINGVTFDAAGLGLGTLAGTEFQTNVGIDAVIANLDAAMTALRGQAAKFGSTLTTVEARQDFTKNLIATLQTGADNLVLADTNEEGANLLALQTRQSLSTTALALANQANQAVLRLFGG